MLRGCGGISSSGSIGGDHPPPPPPVWRPSPRSDPAGFKSAYWTQEAGPTTTWSHESLDLLQTIQTDPPQPPPPPTTSSTSSIGMIQQGKSEVVYAVKDPCASGLTTRRMRLVLLPEDDEPEAEVDDEIETRFCERDHFCRGTNSDALSGWIHRNCGDRQTLHEISEPGRISVRTDLPTNHSTLCPSLSSSRSSGCPHNNKHNRKPAQNSPNRRSLGAAAGSGCLAWCCLRRNHCSAKTDPGKLALCSSSSSAGPGGSGGSPFRSSDFFRDGERISGMRRRRPDEARRMLRGPVLVLFVFIGIALAAVGVAVGFILINTNLLNKSLPNEHSQAVESAANKGPTDYVTVISSLVKPIRDEAGWAYYAKGSVNGSKYHVVHKAMTYSAAQDQCKRYDGYLARINSLREQVFIEDFVQQELEAEGGLLGGVGFWIGARRARGSHGDTCMFDQWKWIDAYGRAHGTISGFTAFIPGKPDNYYSPEECLFLSYRDRDQPERFLKWDDAPCDLNSMGGIKVLCEVEMTSR